MFLKLLIVCLALETVVLQSQSQLNIIPSITNNVLNGLQCVLNEIFALFETVSQKIWIMGDTSQRLPENAQGLLNLCESFLGNITDNNVINSITSIYSVKIGQVNFIEQFHRSFNKSTIMNTFKGNMLLILEQAKIFNQNNQKLSLSFKKYRNALIKAGNAQSTITPGKLGCYMKKYLNEINYYIQPSLYQLRDQFFLPYLTLVNALGADLNCNWNDVPDVPYDSCFKSLDVLLIKGVSNVFRPKTLNVLNSVLTLVGLY